MLEHRYPVKVEKNFDQKAIKFSSNLGDLSSEDQDFLSTLQNRFAFLLPKSLHPFHFSSMLHLGFLMLSGDIAMHH